MQRLKCTVGFDGTAFAGYQVQPKTRTVQGVIETALKKAHKGHYIKTIASGRTDSGVHAHGQVFHFDSPLNIPEGNWVKALNVLLPDDVLVKKVEVVDDDFHARFNVSKKEYRYRILYQQDVNLFKRLYTHHVPYQLDIPAMIKAATWIKGEHDFSSFCASGTSITKKVRTVYELEISQLAGNELVIRMIGSGFLYQMVRITVGNLLAVGRKKIEPEAIGTILDARDRRQAFPTAPPQGLFLWEVLYDK